MRTLLGYLTILIFMPLLTLLFWLTSSELNQVEGFVDVIDKKIPLNTIELSENSYINAADGSIVSEITNSENRVYLHSNEIPPILKDIFVTIEDRNFYQHSGVDASAISRALVKNVQSSDIKQGGSTITQQVARNLYLTQEKTYNRKMTELLYSYQLERLLDKEKILELYINAIYFNNGAYGIEAASKMYFNKSAAELNTAELAFLAGIPNNPTMYNPYKHFDAAKKRQVRILSQLVSEQKLSQDEYATLVNVPIHLHASSKVDLYPDYVTYVHDELYRLVAQAEGLTDTENKTNNELLRKRIDQLYKSGITIHTALDRSLQAKAKQAVHSQLQTTEAEGAAVVIQHNTHELVSMIGGKDYIKNSFNRAYQGFRQPGSAIKPLLVYAPYIERTKAHLSERVSSDSFCQKNYCPQNYSGSGYGMVTIKKAFAASYNTPAIRIFQKNGIKKSFQFLDSFHFRKVNEMDHNLSSALGGFTYGVSPLELTNAYSSFSDGGYRPARAIRNVTDKEGNILYQWNDAVQPVWSADTVKKMRELLHETVQSGTAKKAAFNTPYIGGKTGTTNGFKDLWFVGLTTDYTTGVWVGKDTPSSIESLQKAAPQLLIWKNINQ